MSEKNRLKPRQLHRLNVVRGREIDRQLHTDRGYPEPHPSQTADRSDESARLDKEHPHRRKAH